MKEKKSWNFTNSKLITRTCVVMRSCLVLLWYFYYLIDFLKLLYMNVITVCYPREYGNYLTRDKSFTISWVKNWNFHSCLPLLTQVTDSNIHIILHSTIMKADDQTHKFMIYLQKMTFSWEHISQNNYNLPNIWIFIFEMNGVDDSCLKHFDTSSYIFVTSHETYKGKRCYKG